MNKVEFEVLAHSEGYAEPRTVHFQPLSRSEPHSHDKTSFVYVLEGEFILNTSNGAPSYKPGDACLLDKDIYHAEEAGPEGATILVARK